MNHFPNFWVKIPKFDNYHPPPIIEGKVQPMGSTNTEAMLIPRNWPKLQEIISIREVIQ